MRYVVPPRFLVAHWLLLIIPGVLALAPCSEPLNIDASQHANLAARFDEMDRANQIIFWEMERAHEALKARVADLEALLFKYNTNIKDEDVEWADGSGLLARPAGRHLSSTGGLRGGGTSINDISVKTTVVNVTDVYIYGLP